MQQTEPLARETSTGAADALRRLIETVWNERNVDALDAILAPDFVMTTPGGVTLDAAGYAEAVRAHLAGFPDMRVEIISALDHGEIAAARVLMTGTMLGPFGGHPPTERAMRVEGRPWVRVANGRIAEFWSLADDASMWAQLGLPPHVL